jgi:hypothetical protein
VSLVFVRSVPEFSESIEEHSPSQGVSRFPFVESDVDPSPEFGVADVLEQEQCPLDPTEFAQCHREPILPRVGPELSEHQRRRHGAVLDGRGETQNLVPVSGDLFRVYCPADKRSKSCVTRRFLDCEQLRIADIPDARREPETEQVTQPEYVVGETSSVGVVFLNSQVGFMVKQTVENMRRIPNGGVNEFGVKWRVLVRDVSVKRHARIIPVACVHISSCLSDTTGLESLSV